MPDTAPGSAVRPPIVVSGIDGPDGGVGFGVAELLARPISHHFCEHGEYRDRRNGPEADYVAELVRGLLRRNGDDPGGPTIGVVAFSEAQQSAIEDSLDELAAIDSDFAERYERELTRTEDDEFVGLFVKNLENIQGDERDIVIMSVCYGPAPDGRIKMNFGPINNAGGERRLNVIFSRAKRHMAVVASMRGSDITNVHNEGANHLAGFLRYAEAESVGDQATAQAILDAQVADLAAGGSAAARSASPVAEQVAATLRSRGWSAETSVGRSSFRIDVAVSAASDRSAGAHGSAANDGSAAAPDPAGRDGSAATDRRLGIRLEPATGSSGHARFVAEAGVLDAPGRPARPAPR